jgi:hypothetical protein
MPTAAEKVRARVPRAECLDDSPNDLFLIGGDPAGLHNPFDRTFPVHPASPPTCPLSAAVFGNVSRVYVHEDAARGTVCYRWGHVTHPSSINDAALMEWCVSVAAGTDLSPFRELLGHFVIVVDDRRRKRITLINDALGVRPMYVGAYRGRLVAGSDVLAICRAGLSRGETDYDAVAAWLMYNQTLDGESVVTDYAQLPPMSVRTYDTSGRLVCDRTYGPLPFGRVDATQEQVVDDALAAASRALVTQTRGFADINFQLSGGYDSRLLFAIARTKANATLHAATLFTRDREVELSRRVASAFGHPLELIRSRSRILDLFDEPFAFLPSGFVTAKNLTNCLARMHPGMPLVSGYLGDGTMRGSLLATGNAYFAQDDQNLSDDALVDALHNRYLMRGHRRRLLSGNLATRLESRGKSVLRNLLPKARASTKPLLYADLFSRQRFYYSNVFLQHLDVTDAITPFASWGALSSRVRYAIPRHNERSYPLMFERHFPMLADIPHTIQLEPADTDRPATPPTRHLRRWSADLAAASIMTDLLGGVRKRSLLKLLPSGLLGESLYEQEVLFVTKLLLFERAVRKAHIHFDWAALAG